MAFTKKEWQDTRPSDCKASGVGEACGEWAKHCKDVDKIADNQTAVSAALKAIDGMITALKTAEGKLGKSKEPKKVPATKTLITEWRKEATAYQNELNKAVFTAFAEELKEKAKTVTEAVNRVLSDNEDTVKSTISKMLDDAENAIKKKDVDASEMKLTSAKRKIFDMNSFAKSKVPDTIKVESERVKLPNGQVKVSDVSAAVNSLKSALKIQADRAAKLDKEWDELVDGASPTEPDTSKDDPTTKKNTETVLTLYKATLKDLSGCQTQAQALLLNCKKINGNPLIKSNPTGMVTVMTKAADQIEKIKEDAKKVMFDIRESGGKCVKKRQELFKPDNAKPFTPFLTRGITINGRMITTLSAAEDELKEALEEIIADGNEEAVGPAKSLLGKL